MRLPIALALGLLSLAGSPPARADIDFTLHREQVSSDAVALEKAYVVEGAHKIYLSTPAGWLAAGNPAALTLTPAHPTGAIARFDQGGGGNAGKPPGHDEANRKLLREQALALLPPGAKEVAFQGEEANPVVLFGWTSHEVTHAYSYFGQPYLQSTLFVRTTDSPRLLRVTVTARRGDFREVYPPVRTTLLSWFEQDIALPVGVARTFQGN